MKKGVVNHLVLMLKVVSAQWVVILIFVFSDAFDFSFFLADADVSNMWWWFKFKQISFFFLLPDTYDDKELC